MDPALSPVNEGLRVIVVRPRWAPGRTVLLPRGSTQQTAVRAGRLDVCWRFLLTFQKRKRLEQLRGSIPKADCGGKGPPRDGGMNGWRMGALQGRPRRLDASRRETAEWKNLSFGQKRNKDRNPGGVVAVLTVCLLLCPVERAQWRG